MIEESSDIAEIRAAASVLVERIQWMRQAGITFEGMRDLYEVLGYDRTITAKNYRERYERGGIATRAVDALPKATWRGDGELVENDDPEQQTTFEQDWWKLNDQHHVWSTFLRVDILATLGRYAVLLIGAPGDLSTELPRGRPGGLLYLTPFAEEYAKIESFVEDAKDPRFGKPKTYFLKRTDFSSPDLQKPVHWSRIVHIPSEGFLDDDVYGPPALKSVWNYFDDLEKVVGGGSEAFWLRANQGLHVDIDKKMDLETAKGSIENLKEQLDNYIHHISKLIRTRGATVKSLGSDVADFSKPADTILTLISGTRGIPKRILTGSEMGELASSQDRDNWHDQIKDRRTSYAGPVIVRGTIDRFLKYSYLSQPKEYSIRWPTIQNLNDTERMDLAAKAMSLNDHGVTVVLPNEVRDQILEWEPLDEEDLLPDDEEQAALLEAALRRGGIVNFVLQGKKEQEAARTNPRRALPDEET